MLSFQIDNMLIFAKNGVGIVGQNNQLFKTLYTDLK